MNKQQLASKIWESANKMRSKIEANEYKDYILGFIFYKFLSDKEVKYLKALGYTDDDIDTVTEEEAEIVENVLCAGRGQPSQSMYEAHWKLYGGRCAYQGRWRHESQRRPSAHPRYRTAAARTFRRFNAYKHPCGAAQKRRLWRRADSSPRIDGSETT